MFFLYLHPGPHHRRREGHPHEEDQEDKIYLLNITIFTCFMSSFSRQTDINKFLESPN